MYAAPTVHYRHCFSVSLYVQWSRLAWLFLLDMALDLFLMIAEFEENLCVRGN